MQPPHLLLQIILCTVVISAVGVLPPYSRLEVPFAHYALSGDVQLWLHAPPSPLPPLALSVWRLDSGRRKLVGDVILHQHSPWADDGRTNATKLTLPCGYLAKSGAYMLRLRTADQNVTETETYEDSKLSGILDVRWPPARLSMTPENIDTFPEYMVTGIVEFPEVKCSPVEAAVQPQFWLELCYCGDTFCPSEGETVTSTLYSVQIKGLPGRKESQLSCELFGAAGTYALILRPTEPIDSANALTPTPAYLKARWSKQFVLNVNSRSIFPCDGYGGITVSVQYPACILNQTDCVRVYAREPSSVGSLAAITGLGRDSDSLKYVAEKRIINGSPLVKFPCEIFTERYLEYCFVYVSKTINGAVSNVREECLPTLPISDSTTVPGWGEWTSWSPCPSGCEGTRTRYRYCDSPAPSHQRDYCKGQAVESEPCKRNGTINNKQCLWEDVMTGSSNVNVGSECLCGCVLRLGSTTRSITASAQTCKGISYWLLQASAGHVVKLMMEKYRMSCGAQKLKVHDGNSRGAILLAEWPGEGGKTISSNHPSAQPIIATGQNLLLEFYSEEISAAGNACSGGFLVSASQIEAEVANASASMAGINSSDAQKKSRELFLLIVIIITGLVLTAPALCWIILRVLHASRKYQRAADCDSLADSDITPGSAAALTNRLTGSSGTLLSEVLSLKRLRIGRTGSMSGSQRLLRESKDLSEERPLDAPQNDVGDNHNSSWSSGSSVTLAAVDETSIDIGNNGMRPCSGGSLPATNPSHAGSTQASPLRRSRTCSPARTNHATPHRPHQIHSLISDGDTTSISVDISTSERDSDNSCDNKESKRSFPSQNIARRTAFSENDSRSDSATTLTNGCYSPALSSTSCAKVRSTNGKERKERRNLRLKAPLSDLSLAAPEFEFDYYDYNVTNAGAAPGSYLGMDPAYLVWIPPLEEGDIIKEIDEQCAYDDALRNSNLDPGSNTESPEEYHEQSYITRHHVKTEENTPNNSPRIDRRLAMKTNIVHPLNFSISDLPQAKKDVFFEPTNRRGASKNEKFVSIQMKELLNNKIQSEIPWKHSNQSEEKETFCEKSTLENEEKYSNIDDIQFADEDSDESIELKLSNEQSGSTFNRDPNKVMV